MSVSYDIIGVDYAQPRKADPRIASMVAAAFGLAKSIGHVGAGAGSYEPEGRRMTALEPSVAMIRQRRTPAAALVRGVAQYLPFADGSFDAETAILTLHHWSYFGAGPCRDVTGNLWPDCAADLRRGGSRLLACRLHPRVGDARWRSVSAEGRLCRMARAGRYRAGPDPA